MVFLLGPAGKNQKEEILYNWPSSDNTLVHRQTTRHVIQNEYYEVDSKVNGPQITLILHKLFSIYIILLLQQLNWDKRTQQ